MLLLVRPKPKLTASLEYFAQQGVPAVGVAPVDIKSNQLEMDRCLAFLNTPPSKHVTFVFTSTEAANRFANLAKSINFSGCNALCIGESTATIASPFFQHCFTPKQQTSEGLIDEIHAHPSRASWASPLLLIKGNGGREVIQTYFAEQNAKVGEFNLYKRVELSTPFESDVIEWNAITTVVVTSAFLLQCLFRAYPQKRLTNKTWIVPSERVKEVALSLGCKDIVSSNGATNSHLLGCVYKRQRGQT